MKRNALKKTQRDEYYEPNQSSSVGFILRYKKISPERKEELERIMRKGGEVLKKMHLKIRQVKRLRANNPKLSYCRRQFRTELFKEVGATPRPVAICGVLITKEEVQRIYAIRACETEILEGYSNLIRRIIFSKANTSGSYVSVDDCCEEGAMAIIDSAYHYLKEDSRFSTFVFWSIFRRVHRAINKAKRNFPWSAKMRELFQRYQNAQRDINRAANFEDIVTFMGLEDEEREILRAALVQMISEGDETDNGDSYGHEGLLSNCAAVEETISLDADELAALSAADLTDWEQAVLKAYLNGHHGWRTEVATEWGYSKPAVPIALARSFDKIKMAYETNATGDSKVLIEFLRMYNGKEEVA